VKIFGVKSTANVAKLRFTRWVPADLVDAIAWYDGISPRLGDRFRLAVDAAFDAIQESPQGFPVAFADLRIRFYRLRRFPYLVLYRVDESAIVIVAVLHGASDPEKWRRRVEESS
jgi:plasmid stabilization system protein ParE